MDAVEEDYINNALEEKEATDVDIMVGLYRILNWPDIRSIILPNTGQPDNLMSG